MPRAAGGIGFTSEHDLHWFLKRAKTDGVLFGSARDHRERVAELAGLGASTAIARLGRRSGLV